jgi:hypothetical protein
VAWPGAIAPHRVAIVGESLFVHCQVCVCVCVCVPEYAPWGVAPRSLKQLLRPSCVPCCGTLSSPLPMPVDGSPSTPSSACRALTTACGKTYCYPGIVNWRGSTPPSPTAPTGPATEPSSSCMRASRGRQGRTGGRGAAAGLSLRACRVHMHLACLYLLCVQLSSFTVGCAAVSPDRFGKNSHIRWELLMPPDASAAAAAAATALAAATGEQPPT